MKTKEFMITDKRKEANSFGVYYGVVIDLSTKTVCERQTINTHQPNYLAVYKDKETGTKIEVKAQTPIESNPPVYMKITGENINTVLDTIKSKIIDANSFKLEEIVKTN